MNARRFVCAVGKQFFGASPEWSCTLVDDVRDAHRMTLEEANEEASDNHNWTVLEIVSECSDGIWTRHNERPCTAERERSEREERGASLGGLGEVGGRDERDGHNDVIASCDPIPANL